MMSATGQSVRSLSVSPQPLLSTSPVFAKSENVTPSFRRPRRASCVKRLLVGPKLYFSESVDCDFDINFSGKDSHDISVRISPCSPRNVDEPRAVTVQDSLVNEHHFSAMLGHVSPSRFSISPSVPDSVFSPNSNSPLKVYQDSTTPLYSPDRKDLFLGRGSFGNVTLYQYKNHNLAVKVIQDPSMSEVGEKNLLGINHRHLVRIFHVSRIFDRSLVFMEFAGHCDLQQLLDNKGYLDFRRRISFCYQIASGLEHCHKNSIIHRDVKPANIIVSPAGICKLGDFGHSLKIDSSCGPRVPEVPSPKGTVAYTAPEVLCGYRPVPASDIYSLGVTLWQVKSREVPFAGEHPHTIIYKVVSSHARPTFEDNNCDVNCTVIRQYAAIAELCWGQEPEKRPHAKDVVRSLLRLLDN